MCLALGQMTPQMVSPLNGATGVPTTIGSLIATAAFLSNPITLFPAGGTSIALGSFSPIGNTGNSSIAVPVLTPATKYTLTVTGLITGCSGPNPPPPLTIIGTFTTQ